MNQFNSLDFKGNKQIIEIAKDFDYVLNNLWSTHSQNKGISRWRLIGKSIPSVFYQRIATEIAHVELGHGREQALMAVKSEMVKYLQHMIKS